MQFLGNLIKIYKASTNVEGWKCGNQGHIVSSIILYCFRNKIINEALVTKMSNKDPLSAEACIITSEEEIVESMGSKYQFVDQYSLYKNIKNKSLVVGLPCQLKRIKNKEIIRIGLFCGINTSKEKIDYILYKNNIDRKNIISLNYRDPKTRKMKIIFKNGVNRKILYIKHARLNYFFALKKCKNCFDFSAHYSDISIGDYDFKGTNAIIIRTKRGLNIFENLIKYKYVNTELITIKELIKHRTSPMIIKELGNGYAKNIFIRNYGEKIFWINFVLLSFISGIITFYYKHIITNFVLIKRKHFKKS